MNGFPSPPAPDEIELTFLGPGYGESIVLHLGNNDWVIVDSCVRSGSSEPVPLSYLRGLGVSPEVAVKKVIVTHWHDDHIRGISAVVDACRNARFCCSDALKQKEILRLFAAISGSSMMKSSGVDEIYRTFKILNGRKYTVKPVEFAIENRRLWKRNDADSGLGVSCEIWSLSPSDRAKLIAIESMTRLSSLEGDADYSVRRIPDPDVNHLSTVLLLKAGEFAALLGSDLEERRDQGMAWSAIVESQERPDAKAAVYKLAHHGSTSGHNQRVWTEMLVKNPVACLMPFCRGRVTLPTKGDVARICASTNSSYTTGQIGARPVIKRPSAVMKSIRDTVRYITPVMESKGYVQVRVKPKDEHIPRVELGGGAVELKDIFRV